MMEAMSQFDIQAFHFLRPLWLLAIFPALILAWIFLRDSAKNTQWRNNIDPALLEALLDDKGERANRWASLFTAIGLLFMALALAGPTWNRLPQRMEQTNDALVVILDLSLSMYAQDLSPSRLVHARHKIADILRMREEGFTALVVFAGDAHVVTPLTDDTDTIENLLLSLQPSMMPVAGSNPENAVEQAKELIRGAKLLQGRILILTDGIRDIESVIQFATPDIPISILGIGTEKGAAIPLDFMNRAGDFLPDANGETVIARLNSANLRAAARQSYGKYQTSSIGDSDILHVLNTGLGLQQETEEVERQFDVWADRGYLLILLLIPLLALSFRRGILLLLCICILPAPVHGASPGELWNDLWQRKDQQAFTALQSGQAELAAQIFENPDWQATALYRSGAFDAASGTYRQLDQKYNLGNALARLGDYKGAIKNYESVLRNQPDHQNALFNKQLVEQLQEEKEQQEEQQQEQSSENSEEGEEQEQDGQESDSSQQDSSEQSGDEQDESNSDPSEQEKQEQQKSEQEKNAEDKKPKETDAQAEEENRDEKQEAMEQWLRRVPDDPGGLLKRKFQHETNQRLRSGEFQRSNSEQIW